VLRFDDRWVWDLWVARTSAEYHLFFLQAPRSLGDPDLRHRHASIGHAASADLSSWTVLPDAITRGPAGVWDDLATWTGSVIEHDGLWHMLYTGVSTAEGGLVQRIGLATSSDLVRWTKHPANPILVADGRWYERLDSTAWREEAWRDPWVFRDPEGAGFHALITARGREGPADGRGVIGHATSDDLVSWRVTAPISIPGEFGHLEVPQVEIVDGTALLVFSVGAGDVSEQRRRRASVMSATYLCPAGSLLGPFDLARARAVAVPSLYAGRLVQQHDGGWVMLGFLDGDGRGGFIGEISDPIDMGRWAAAAWPASQPKES
jgi:beta-fructofuranosidase